MAQSPPEQRRWAIGVLACGLLLWSGLLGRAGVLDVFALLWPLALFAHPGLGAGRLLAAGAGFVVAGWLLSEPLGEWPAGLRPLLVLWLGVHLAERAREAGALELRGDDAVAWQRFDEALARELARARRHDRPFALLSADAQLGEPGLLEAKLRDALHRYAVVAEVGERILALVPETADDEVEELVARVEHALRGERWRGLRLGVARFPADALTGDELVAAADRARTSPTLRAVPDTGEAAESAAEPEAGRGAALPEA